MQATNVVMNSKNKLVITITKALEPMKGGTELTIISYILPLPTKLVEVLVVDINT